MTRPLRETLGGLDLVLDAPARAGRGVLALVAVFVGLLIGWWLYVPIHELLHAVGCLATGGSVSRLEIDALYGGALLAAIFPFVAVGSDYAGQLTGFDTGGSAWVYLATVMAPFVLTLFPGVWALRRTARRARALAAPALVAPALWGATLPFALAPFLSLPGDAFEAGGIAVTNWIRPVDGLPSDDAFQWFERDLAAPGDPLLGALALGLGLLGSLAVYALGDRVARGLGQAPLEPRLEPRLEPHLEPSGEPPLETPAAPIRQTPPDPHSDSNPFPNDTPAVPPGAAERTSR